MRKKTVKARKKSPEPKVRKITLLPGQALRAVAPPDMAPVVMPVAPNVVEIVPAPARKKKSWWETLLG